jgi:AraC-like DNA-binding protein
MLRELDGTPEGLRRLLRETVIPSLDRTSAQKLVVPLISNPLRVKPPEAGIEQHPFHELCLGLRGRAEMWVGARVVVCEENQLVIVPSGTPHSLAALHCVTSTPEDVFSRLLWISVFPFGSVLSVCESAYGVHRTTRRHLFLSHLSQSCVEQMLAALRQDNEAGWLMIKYALLQLLVSVWQGQAIDSNGLIERSSAQDEPITQEASRLSERAAHYIRRNYYDPGLGLDAVARALSVNKSHLSRQFKLETGVTVTEYLNQVRVDSASRLLLAGLKVTLVAEYVGFADSYYFSRVFTRMMSCSPSEYRRRGEPGLSGQSDA